MAEEVKIVLAVEAKGNARQALDDVGRAATQAGKQAEVAAKQVQAATGAQAQAVGAKAPGPLPATRPPPRDGGLAPVTVVPPAPVPAKGGDGAATLTSGLQAVAGGPQSLIAAGGPAAAAAIGAMYAVSHAVESLGKAVATLGNEALSADQKTRKLAESLPIVGGIYRGVREGVEGLTGVTERLRVMAVELAKFEAAAGVRGAGRLEIQAAEATAFGARARAGALAGVPRAAFGFAGGAPGQVFTAAEERELGRAERRAAIDISKRTADAEVKASQAAREAADKEVVARKDALAAAQAASDKAKEDLEKVKREGAPALGEGVAGGAKRALGVADKVIPFINPLAAGAIQGLAGGESKVALQAAADEAGKQAQAAQQALREVEAAQQRAAQAAEKAAQAESAARKANLALARENLAVLKEELALAKGRAQAFGSMTIVEQSAAVAIAERFQKAGGGVAGLKQLTPEEIGILQRGGGGEVIQQAQQQLAQQSPLFKQFQEAIGIKPQDIAELQKKIVEANVAITAEIQIDEEKLGESIAKNLEAVVERIAKLLDIKIAVAIRDVEAKFAKQAAGQ